MRVRTRGFSLWVFLTRWRKLVRSRPYCTRKRVAPSVASLGFGSAMSLSWNTSPRHFGPVVPPSGTASRGSTTRVRTHSLSRRGLFAVWRTITRNCSNCARRDRGSELFLLDERRDVLLKLRGKRPADHAGGRGVTAGPSRSVGTSSCTTGAGVA